MEICFVMLPRVLILTVLLLALTTQDAEAYIDPGSGSYLFQILIAGLTALVFFFSAIKQKIVGFFKGESKEEDPLEKPVEEVKEGKAK